MSYYYSFDLQQQRKGFEIKVSNKFSDVDNIKFNKYCCFKKNYSIKLFLFILATQFLWRSFCQLIVDVGRGIL